MKYLIFDDRSWRAHNPSAGWRPYGYPDQTQAVLRSDTKIMFT